MVLASAGDTPNLEVIAAAQILKEYCPHVNTRVINVVDLMRLQSSDKQTLMSKIGGDFYNRFTLDDVTEDYKNGKVFTGNQKDTANILNPVSGATYSANAGNNAVNCVIDYCWGTN